MVRRRERHKNLVGYGSVQLRKGQLDLDEGCNLCLVDGTAILFVKCITNREISYW
jgi:pyruvate formate-lyase activating enzyme-like uncharacterized protein